jgi:group I intron endonuclease
MGVRRAIKKISRNNCGIYMIFNKINNKVYVGQSRRIRDEMIDGKKAMGRISYHFMDLRGNRHHKSRVTGETDHLQHSFNKYGEEAFDWAILKICSEKNLFKWEEYYFQRYNSTNPNNGYNRTLRASGSLCSDETKAKISRANKGKIHTEESRKHMSDAHKGKPSGRKGLPISEKQRIAMESVWEGNRNRLSHKKGKFKYINYKDEWIDLYYYRGWSCCEIGEKYGTVGGCVKRVLNTVNIDNNIGVELRENRRREKLRISGTKFQDEEKINKIIECYRTNYSFSETAKQFNTTHHTIERLLRKEERDTGKQIVDISMKNKKYIKYKDEWIELYQDKKWSSLEISKKYNVPDDVIREVLKDGGVKIRSSVDKIYSTKPRLYKRKYMHLLETWGDLYFNQKKSYNEISKIYNVDRSIIYDYLTKYYKK